MEQALDRSVFVALFSNKHRNLSKCFGQFTITTLFYIALHFVLFTTLAWLGDSEGTFQTSSQAASCVCHTRRRLHAVPLIAERQAGKL